MPIQGFKRFRAWNLGKQSVHGTAVAATRRIGLSGVLTLDPNWQDQEDVDVGSIDPVLPPYRTQLDLTAPWSGPLTYDDIPVLLAAGVIGGVSPTASSTSRTWTHTAASLTATTLDEFTGEWCDDYTQDGFKVWDGVIENLEFSFDEALGPWQVSADWRFGAGNAHVTPTAGLQVGSNLPLVFGADTAIYINDTSGTIGTTQISDALHRATIKFANTIDQKRYANGSNSRFAIGGYGLAGREITASMTFAKASTIAAALASETVNWLSADPVNRYVELRTTSPALAAAAVPYSWSQKFSGTWRMRGDEEIGGNDVITLDFVGRYDQGLGYAYRSVAVNQRTALP